MPDIIELRELRPKLRHRLSTADRFARAIAHDPGEDPVFAALMHSFSGYVHDIPARTELDELVHDRVEQSEVLTKELLGELVDRWESVPDRIRHRIVPEEFLEIPRDGEIDLNLLKRLTARAYPRLPMFKPPTLWHGRARLRPDRFIMPSAEQPEITSVEPSGPDGGAYANLGETFTVKGAHFSSENEANTVVIYRLKDGEPVSAMTSHPTSSTSQELKCIAPPLGSTTPGMHKLQIVVSGRTPSEAIPFWLTEPAMPAGTITGVTPGSQYPGKKLILNVQGVGANPTVWWKSATVAGAEGVAVSPSSTLLSATQVETTLPIELLRNPGQYWVSVGGANQKLSASVPVTVLAYAYSVEFIGMKCIDESDPEWWGDDEIVTRWAVVADGQAWSKGSKEYTGFEDGTYRSYDPSDRTVFPPTGGTGTVAEYLSIGTVLFEWDAGDAEAWNKALGAIAGIVEHIPVIGNIGSWVLKVVGKIIALFGGDPDNLGQITETFTAEELYHLTGPAGTAMRSLSFLNDDDTGSYTLTYAIHRDPI